MESAPRAVCRPDTSNSAKADITLFAQFLNTSSSPGPIVVPQDLSIRPAIDAGWLAAAKPRPQATPRPPVTKIVHENSQFLHQGSPPASTHTLLEPRTADVSPRSRPPEPEIGEFAASENPVVYQTDTLPKIPRPSAKRAAITQVPKPRLPSKQAIYWSRHDAAPRIGFVIFGNYYKQATYWLRSSQNERLPLPRHKSGLPPCHATNVTRCNTKPGTPRPAEKPPLRASTPAPHKWHNETGGLTFGKHHVVARTREKPLAGR